MKENSYIPVSIFVSDMITIGPICYFFVYADCMIEDDGGATS